MGFVFEIVAANRHGNAYCFEIIHPHPGSCTVRQHQQDAMGCFLIISVVLRRRGDAGAFGLLGLGRHRRRDQPSRHSLFSKYRASP